jgi:1,4-alpha-glucan branching enzyme
MFLAPPIPLLFMGEEWDASTPFLFFCDFEPELARLVTAGRRDEFKHFAAFSDPAARERIPDPSAASTFAASKLQWSEVEAPEHGAALAFHRELLRVRREQIAPRTARVRGIDAGFEKIGPRGLHAWWTLDGETLHMEANLGPDPGGGFTERPRGVSIFATHREEFTGAAAPPWSVRWTLL